MKRIENSFIFGIYNFMSNNKKKLPNLDNKDSNSLNRLLYEGLSKYVIVAFIVIVLSILITSSNKVLINLNLKTITLMAIYTTFFLFLYGFIEIIYILLFSEKAKIKEELKHLNQIIEAEGVRVVSFK